MTNWQIINVLKDAGATNDEVGWAAIDAVLSLLDGHITRDEALGALRSGGVTEAEKVLEEVLDD